MTPVEFLTARYDELEGWAKECAELYPSPWDVYDRGHMAKVTADGPVYRNVTELDQAQAVGCAWLGDYLQHIAAHHPDYVLADIAAKRAILALTLRWADAGPPSTTLGRAFRNAASDVVAELLQPFADHPDDDPKWAA